MNRRRFLALAAGAVVAPQAALAAAAPRRLTIVHVVSNCHVWKLGPRMLGPKTKLALARGESVVVRPGCPMDFDVAQLRGPKVELGGPRLYRGTTQQLRFARRGTYAFEYRNVQTPEEANLQTLGEPNTLVLTVVVR